LQIGKSAALQSPKLLSDSYIFRFPFFGKMKTGLIDRIQGAGVFSPGTGEIYGWHGTLYTTRKTGFEPGTRRG
jgi:hypothetical protein